MAFEQLKQRLHEKFQREVRRIDIDGEVVYFKKVGFLVKDWQRVYPPVSEDGTTWNKKALIFGSKQNMVKSTLIFVLAVLVILAFKEYTSSLTAFLQQPEVRACLTDLGYTIG